MAQQPQVGGELVSRLGDPRQGSQDGRVHLSGVGLAGDRLDQVKAHLRGDLPIQLQNLVLIPAEELQEAGLGAGGSLAAQQLQVGQAVLHLLQIHEQLVHPEGGPLAHGDHLGGLIVGVAQGGQSLVFVGKLAQSSQDTHQLVPDKPEGLAHDDDIGVVPHIAAGGPQVDDAGGLGSHQAIGIDMGHHIMAHFLFPGGGGFKIDFGQVGFQLLHLLLGHRQTQGMLRLGKRYPELPPGDDSLLSGEQVQHILGSVAGGQGGFIAVSHTALLSQCYRMMMLSRSGPTDT